MSHNLNNIFNEIPNSNKPSKFSNAPTISYRCLNNKTWDMISIHGSCREIMDCSSNEFTTNKISLAKLINEKDVEMVWEVVQAALKNRMPYQLTYYIKTPLNNEKMILEQGQGLFIHNKLVDLYGFISEVTPPTILTSADNTHILINKFTEELIQLTQKKFNNNIEYKLSSREIEILVYTCKGMTMKEIGNQFNLSPRTVEMHLNRLKNKLQCVCRSELKALFFKTETGKKLIAIL